MSLTFRWLGAAGVELQAGDHVLALDPFFTRPSLVHMLLPLQPDAALAAAHLPRCNAVLVTHAHYDHLLDVPAVLQHTGAVACGSANTCQLLRVLGVPQARLKLVHVGDTLNLGAFQVQVIKGQHSAIPLGGIFNGKLRSSLRPPLHVYDYRMDECLGYSIQVMGAQVLVCAACPQPADVVFAVAQESKDYFLKLLSQAQPHTFIPIHWDNFTRPLSQPLRRFTRPGRLSLGQLVRLAHLVLPRANVIIPEIFRETILAT